MPFDAHVNFGRSTVATAPSPAASGTSVTVATGEGSLFPAAPFNAVICPTGVAPLASNAEIVRVTAKVGDVFTITRTQESSSARTVLVGDVIAAVISAKTITDIENAIPSTAGLLSNINISAGTTSNNLSAFTFANGGGVTFGLNGSTITATVQTNYLTTAMASNRGSDFVQATAVFAGTNASGTIASGGISVSVAPPTAASINFSAGTTSNNLTQVSFKDTNGVTFGLNAGTITATVKTDYLTTARASNDAVGLNTAQTNVTWTVNSSGISINAGGYAGTGFTSTTTAGTALVGTHNTAGLSVGVPVWLTTAALSADSSKYAGTGFTSAGNNIGISGTQNTAGLSLSLTVAAQSNQSAIKGLGVSTLGQTSGNTGLSTGIDWVLAGSDSITLHQSTAGGGPNTIWFKHPAWLTTADLSQNSSKYVGTGFTSAGANVGISGTNNTAGLSLSITVAAQTNQSAIKGFGASNVGQTAGNTGLSTGIDWVLAGSDSITVRESTVGGGPNTLWLQHPAWLTTADLSANSSKYAQAWELTGNTAGTTSSAQGTKWYFSGGANLTISGNSNTLVFSAGSAAPSPVNFSAGTTSGNLGSVVFSNSGAISFGLNGSTITASANTTSYNTVGIQTTEYPVASANSVGTVTRWAAEDHRHAGVGGIGISTAGNTSGTTGSQVGTYWIQASNGLTASQITSNNGSHTLILSGSFPMGSYWANIPDYGQMVTGASAITQTSGSSLFVQPFFLPYAVSASFIRFLASFNDSAVGTAGTPVANTTFSVDRYTTFALVLYSQGVGASSRSIQSMASSSAGLTGRSIFSAGAQSSQYTMTLQKTYPQSGFTTNNYTTSYAVSSGSIVISSNSNTLFTGPRFLDIPWAASLSPGNYWLAIGASTSSNSNSANISFAGTAAMPMSLAGNSASNVSVGALGAATSASDNQLLMGLGVWTTNASVISKDSIGVNSVSQVVSNPQLPFQFIRQA